MRKFPKLKYPGDPETDGILNGDVVVTEKLDGANFRFSFGQDGLIVGTRNHHFPVDDPNIPKAFRHAIEYIQSWPDRTKDILRGAGTFFGEAMHLHTLGYPDIDWRNPASGPPHVPLESDTPNVVLFDWWRDEPGEWAEWGRFESIAQDADLPLAPIIERGDPDHLALEVPEESVFGGPPEGIVVRRIDGTVRAKKVTDDFQENNAVAFDDPSKAQSDAAEFVAAYVTKPRIEKVAHKLVDAGEYDHLEMPMMQDLPRAVIEDVGAEVFWSDLMSGGGFEAEWDDDFKSEVRSKASKKCARVLKQAVNSF